MSYRQVIAHSAMLRRLRSSQFEGVYTGIEVERTRWAQAHFFIGIRSKPMADRNAVIEKIREIADRAAVAAAPAEHLEVVDVQLLGGGGTRVLRIFIDKPAGVTHGDCELMSQQVGTMLDIEDVIPGGRYTLEVSSPGVERKLAKPSDFERFVGQKVKVILRQPVEKQRHWAGVLKSFAQGTITLEPSPGKHVEFPLDQVEKANLKFEW
jgi:ribosome maturation factor RimP